ncbi:hypothetical protein ACFL6R_00445 [Gemmatimonadota bacterium]
MERRTLLKRIPLVVGCPLIIGCEEHLPKYVAPSIELTAFIFVERTLSPANLIGGGLGEFGLDIRNIAVAIPGYDYVLYAPFEVEAFVTVSHAEQPSKNINISGAEVFDENLPPGQTIRVTMTTPTRDSNNRLWNAHDPETRQHDIVFQGRAEIEKITTTLNTRPRTATINYF